MFDQRQHEEDLKVFLVDVVTKDITPEILADRMNELENLVNTYWWVVILQKYQKKQEPDHKTYVGKWKLEEIIEDMQRLWANTLIIGNILKPRQTYYIEEKLRPYNIKVRDRVDLILKIFGKHAEWWEARLQIELASIKHMWPRIYGMWMELSRQWWSASWSGWAMRGLWETNTEIMRRHLKDKQRKILQKLKEYEKMRELHRNARIKKWLPTVWIVWYTNSGKSTLLNSMTKKWVLAENKLFATLGTNVWKFYLITDPKTGLGHEILLNDTIWFIRDLPPKLIQAFKSTLEDSVESDILFHVIDAWDKFVQERIDVVDEILSNIWANQERILVFNKIDTISTEKLQELKQIYSDQTAVRISAKQQIWLDDLKNLLIEKMNFL